MEVRQTISWAYTHYSNKQIKEFLGDETMKANLMIVDGRIDDEIYNNLKKLNIQIIKTIKCEEVDESISYHPDIVIHPLNPKTIIVAPNVFDYYVDKLSGMGIKIIKGEKFLDMQYPDDIAYNVGRLSGVAIHNFKHTDEKLKCYLKKEKLELINVNQGYTKCSLAILDQYTGITSDYPMYKKLINYGFKILLIEPGHILLEGQKYGFIGGASGNLDKNKFLLSGSIEEHPNKEDILEFVEKNNKKLIFLSEKRIVDIGTLISLNSH